MTYFDDPIPVCFNELKNKSFKNKGSLSVYKQKRPTVVDLFAGCGGMSLGFEAAGFDVVASVEIDPIHSLVHHFNFPYTATICKDIRNVTGMDILEAVEQKGLEKNIDVVVGGPPCQGFSHIGKRILDDPRNNLVFEYLRIIKELEPKYFVFENVPGIASGKHSQFLSELISELDNIGYKVVTPYKVLNAADYGVPQSRRRLILIGYRSDMLAPEYPLATHTQQGGASLFGSNLKYTGASDAISDLENVTPYIGEDSGITYEEYIYKGFQKSYDFEPNGEFLLCHKRMLPKMIWGHIGSNHTDLSIQRFLATPPGEVEKVSRFFKLHPDKPCNTLRAGTASDRGAYTAPRPIHYSTPRCITVREAARLHGFPDWFQFHRTIWHGFREIGNAVSPLFAKKIADVLINRLTQNKKDFEVYEFHMQSEEMLMYNMNQASDFWGVANDVIPKRKRLVGAGR